MLYGTLTFDNYPLGYVKSDARREKYYRQGNKFPEKYVKGLEAGWCIWAVIDKGKPVLYDRDTKKPILANYDKAGKPLFSSINGNKLHTCTMKGHERDKVMKTLHAYFKELVSKIDFSLLERSTIKFNFHIDPSEIYDGDVDNHSLFYTKAFHDELTVAGKWPNDNTKWSKGFWVNHEYAKVGERKLVIQFYKLPEDDDN